ncbi:8629_t:CDS:2, partial [Dentiscutata erythropus]
GLEDLGRTNIVQHYIDTGSASPIKQAAYQLAPNEQKFLQEETMWEMDENEVIDMNRQEQGYEQLLHDFEVESGCRLLWEGHSDIAQQW